ncbi:MAG: hypothetical protein ABFS45_27290, partial [Pseudomonadota bacterium]
RQQCGSSRPALALELVIPQKQFSRVCFFPFHCKRRLLIRSMASAKTTRTRGTAMRPADIGQLICRASFGRRGKRIAE